MTTFNVAWSNGMWGATYANGVGVSFERFDAQGKSLGLATPIGATSFSGTGTLLVATKTGWALVSTGEDASLFEIDAKGTVTYTVPFGIQAGAPRSRSMATCTPSRSIGSITRAPRSRA